MLQLGWFYYCLKNHIPVLCPQSGKFLPVMNLFRSLLISKVLLVWKAFQKQGRIFCLRFYSKWAVQQPLAVGSYSSLQILLFAVVLLDYEGFKTKGGVSFN